VLADLVKAPEALGVDMQELARALALIAQQLRAYGTRAGRASVTGQHLADRRGRQAEDRPEARRSIAAVLTCGEEARLKLGGAATGLADRDRAPIA
jgi:hypothetical protein